MIIDNKAEGKIIICRERLNFGTGIGDIPKNKEHSGELIQLPSALLSLSYTSEIWYKSEEHFLLNENSL